MAQELFAPEGLTWNDHPDIYLAEDIMPAYIEFSYCMTPKDFITTYWKDSSDGLRSQMIEYIEMRPFDGCDKYIMQWNSYLEHNKNRVFSLN